MPKKGEITDRTGEKHINNQGLMVEVIAYRSNDDCDIRFEDGVITIGASYGAVRGGQVRNKNFRNNCGIGYFGYGKFNGKAEPVNFYFNTWRGVFARSYNEKFHQKHPTYIGCSVSEKWHNFQDFAQWMEDNHNPEIMKGWHLDKDIIKKGNKTYSPETCAFVPPDINTLFGSNKAVRGEYPIGVKPNKKRFAASVAHKHLGTYDTPELAFLVYKQAKEQNIKEVANKWKDLIDPRVYEALYNYTVEITD